MPRSSRARRTQQIMLWIISVLIVVAMGLSLVATLTPQPRLELPTLTAWPTLPPLVFDTPTPSPQAPATPTAALQ